MKITETIRYFYRASYRLAWFFMICANLAFAESVTFTTNTTISRTNLSYEGFDVTVNHCVLTVAGPHSFNSLTVIDTGTVTHVSADTGGLHLNITDDVFISSGCRIDVSAMGFPHDQGPGAGGFGNWGGGGGGYGGVGGNGYDAAGGTTYGLDTQPQLLGSGGGSRTVGGLLGGAGGGRVQLIVGDSVHVDGEIRAAGGNGGGGGGGSGGSIFVTASRITGSGTIQANGGAGNQSPEFRGGGGGGGRVSLDGSVLIPVGNIHANGGYAYQASGLDGTVRIVGAVTQAVFTSNTTISRTDLSYEGFDITVSHCVLTVAGPHSFSSLTVIDTGTVTHASADTGGVNLTIAGDLVIAAGSKVSGDGRGYGSNGGLGAGSQGNRGGGGAYGGNGGIGENGTLGGTGYGSITMPTSLGSGGGFATNNNTAGGSGGGAIHLTVGGTLRVDGFITANGNNGSTVSGGGSGGSIYLNAGVLAGTGTLSSNGGLSTTYGGGGGGGRIALYYDTGQFSGTLTACGGSGYQYGGAGTIYTKRLDQSFGDVLVSNCSHSGAATQWGETLTCDTLSIGLNGILQPFDSLAIIGSVAVDSSGRIQPVIGQPLNLFVSGNLIVESGGQVAANGRGYGSNGGLGAGSQGNRGGGGAYGGNGGIGENGTLGGTGYGSITMPTSLGSGGGFATNNNTAGGSGGGAIHLTVGGTLRVDGFITANGNNGSTVSGGGSGGSIYLNAGVLAGTGTLSSNGGLSTYGGGGGGGRIALYYDTLSMSQNLFTSNGGIGFQAGQPGTVFLGGNTALVILESPNGGESLAIGDSTAISWSTPIGSDTFALEINRSFPTGLWESLANQLSGSTVFNWVVTGPQTSNARVRVRSLTTPALSDTSDNDFSIGNSTLSLTLPNGNETWDAGSTQAITWSSQYLTENVRIEINRNYPINAWETIIASTANDGAHSWLATAPISGAARVRIIGVFHTSVGDTSDANFTIAMPTLSLTAPNGGQTWYITHSDTIRWTSQNLAGNVNVELNRAFPSGGWESIVANTTNDGVHVWTVAGAPSVSARFRITSVNVPTLSDTSDANLSIAAPSITLSSPNTSLSWYVTQPETILWISNQLSGNVRIELMRGYPSGAWENIVASTPNGGNHVWTVSSPLSTNCRIRVSSVIASTVADTSDVSFAILNPTIAITAPNGGEVWDIGDTMNVTWQAPELAGNVRIDIDRAFPSDTWTSIVSSVANTGSYAWRVNYPATANARIRVTSASLSSVSDTSNGIFVIPPPPPELLPGQAANPFPVNNDVNVSPTPLISWSPAAGAEMYDLYLWPDTAAMPGSPRISNSTNTFYQVTTPALLSGLTYDWQVVAKNVYGEMASPEWQFTVRALPDLRVFNVQTSEAHAGQSLQVSWTITNTGAGSTITPQWQDRIWLSTDFDVRVGEPDNTQLGQYPSVSSLASGESYIQTQTIQLPGSEIGVYYLFVVTDANEAVNPDSINWYAGWGHGFVDVVDEANEYNNFNFIQINILPSPVPDLVVDSVQTALLTPIASTAFSGDSINASWRVVNQGEVITPISSWSDGVYLSTDNEWDAGDALLGSRIHNGTLEVDSSYLTNLHVRLPNSLDGEYTIVVKADRSEQIYEYIWEFNNDSFDSITVIPAPPPDFVVTAVNTPLTATNRETLIVQWTVHNDGAGEPFEPSWSDKIYISALDTFNITQATLLGSLPHFAPLDADCTYSAQMNVVIPNGVEGTHYVYVYADGANQVFEGNQEQNNATRATGSLLVTVPNLAVQSVVAPSGAESGDTTQTISWTIRNVGVSPLLNGSWGDRLFLTTSATFDTSSAIVKMTVTRSETIAPDSSYTDQATLIIPNGVSGNYYVHMKADYADQIYEGTLDIDNTGRSALMPISLSPWPDLQVTTIQVPETTMAGQSIVLSFTVANVRNTATPNSVWNDKVYLSVNATWNPAGATLLQTVAHSGQLAADTVYSVTRTQNIGAGLVGNYYLYVKTDADSVVYEHSDEGNNITRSNPIWINAYPPVDLVVTNLTAPDSVNSGQQVNLQWSVQNIGQARTLVSSWRDALYLSADSVYSAGLDSRLDAVSHAGYLNAGQFYSASREVTIPNGLNGSYFVIVRVDTADVIGESLENNNHLARRIEIVLPQSPDLAVFDFSAQADSVIAGREITCSWVVRNLGVAPVTTVPWYDAIFLSLNPTLSNSDTRLATVTRSSVLIPGDSIVESRQVTIPSYVSGNFYLILKTDNPNAIYEHASETNNVSVRPISITLAALSDLIVTDIQVPESAMVGDPVSVTWTLTNIGVNPAIGTIRDGVYFSADTAWDLDDPLLGFSDRFIDIAPGASLTMSNTVRLDRSYRGDENGLDGEREGEGGNMLGDMPGLLPGSYHAIVRTDMRDVVRETSNTNNYSISTARLSTIVPLIELGVPIETSLIQGAIEYYRFEVVDSLVGRTLGIVVGCQTLGVSNECFIAQSHLPSEFDFDYSSTHPFSPSQEVIIPSAETGFYYIAVHCVDGPAVPFLIELSVDKREFELLSLDLTEGGQGGDVTVGLHGSGFRPSITRVALLGSDAALVANRVLFVDPSTVYATFDLLGAPVGLYDLTVVQDMSYFLYSEDTLDPVEIIADSAVVTLTDGFSIVHGEMTPGEIMLIPPNGARTGRGFSFEVVISNGSNNDIAPPLLFIYGEPDVSMATQHNSTYSYGGIKVLAISEIGPASIIRPHQSVYLAISARAPSQSGPVVLHVDPLDGSGIAFDLNSELDNIGIDPQAPAWIQPVAHLSQSIGEDGWEGLRHQLVNTAGRLTLENSRSPLLEDLVLSTLRQWFQDSLYSEASSGDSLDGLMDRDGNRQSGNFVLDDENRDIGCSFDNPDCDRSFTYEVILTGIADAWSEQLWIAAAQHMFHFMGGTGQSISYGPTSRVSWEARYLAYFGPDKVPAIINALESRVYADIENNIDAGRSCLQPRDLATYIAALPVAGCPQLNTWQSLNLTFAFGFMSGPTTGYIDNISCTPNSDGSVVSFRYDMNLTFNDIYEFVTEHRGRPFACYGYALQQCGDAAQFPTSFRIRETVTGAIEILPEDPQIETPESSDRGITDTVNFHGSIDPNVIVGPAGYGDNQFVELASLLPYTINFENDPDLASAPAQSVRVTQQLDSTLDFTSFRLGSFGFGNMIFEVPENRAHYSARVDARDSLGAYVDVIAGLNVSTGEIFWDFHSVDPLTGELPLNPFAGFLPVNDTLTHHGEGFVTYTIRPRDDARTGERVDAEASIVFDVNEPVITPPIYNTIDAGPPTSSMDSQAVFLDSTTFVIAWHGIDDSLGSGIASFDLYQSVNQSPFELVESALTDTVYTVPGGWYNHYRYFTIAKDNVGNVEPMKLVGELTVDLSNPPTVLSVDSLTIKITSYGAERVAELYWPRALPDSTADSTTQIGYWIYTRADISGGSFGWYFLASTVDTFYSYTVPAQSDELIRMFLVAAYQTTSQSGMATPPHFPPAILLERESEVPQSVITLTPKPTTDAAKKTDTEESVSAAKSKKGAAIKRK